MLSRPGIQTRIFGLITLPLLLIYALTTSSHITLGDAGDLIAGAATLGISHPPGYPTFVLLGFVVSKIFWFLEPAYLMNLLNALYAALGVGVLGLVIYKLIPKWPIAVFGGLALGLTPSVWALATSTEVYSLNLLFNNILWLLALNFRSNRTPRNFFIYCFVLGLALTNSYPLILLTGLGMILVFPRETFRPKLMLQGALFILIGLLPYLYLAIQSLRSGQIDYVFMELNGLDKVIPFIMRSQYLFLDQKSSPLFEKFHVFGMLIWEFIKDFSLTSVLIGTGLYAAFKTKWELRWPFLVATTTASVLLFILLGTTSDTLEFSVFYDYVLPGLGYLAVFAAFGLNWVQENYSVPRNALLALCGIALCTETFHSFPVANYRGDNTVEAWSSNVFDSLPQNTSLVICSDLSMPLKYLQLLKDVRPDVTFYTGFIGFEDRKWYYFTRSKDISASLRSTLTIQDLLKSERSPVYTLDCESRFLAEGLHVVLKGLAYQIITDLAPEKEGLPLTKPAIKTKLDSILIGPPNDNYWMNRLRESSAARILTYAYHLKLINADELERYLVPYGLLDDPRFLGQIGAELAYAADYDLSLKFYDRVGSARLVAADPEDVAVYCRILLATQKLELAQSVCAIPDKPANICNADAKYNLGRAYWKDKESSLRYLRTAVHCNPTSALLSDALAKRESEP